MSADDVRYALPRDPRTWFRRVGPFTLGRNFDVPPRGWFVTDRRSFAGFSCGRWSLTVCWR